jgi:glucose/mannose-6-phosphate isomerase
MNLDDLSTMKRLDPQDMLAEIEKLPDQLQSAWDLGQGQSLSGFDSASTGSARQPSREGFQRVVVSGMGGSAIGASLLAAYVAPDCRTPIFVHRDYGLPAWARGPETLVIASSHSGNTEETLDSFQAALENKCSLMAVSTGGKLAERAGEKGLPVWRFEHQGQPRAAVGFSFGLLLAAFSRLELIDPPEKVGPEVSAAVKAMKAQQQDLGVDVPAAKNPAKRQAGQLVGRWVNVYGSGRLEPVARRWKDQINELAKAGAGFEALPEADHNALAGLKNPEETLARTVTLFLRAPCEHPRNRLRADLTRETMMVEGLATDFYDARGDTPLAHIWTTLHFGDYMAYYLAMAYGVDPTPIEALKNFKAAMAKAK